MYISWKILTSVAFVIVKLGFQAYSFNIGKEARLSKLDPFLLVKISSVAKDCRTNRDIIWRVNINCSMKSLCNLFYYFFFWLFAFKFESRTLKTLSINLHWKACYTFLSAIYINLNIKILNSIIKYNNSIMYKDSYFSLSKISFIHRFPSFLCFLLYYTSLAISYLLIFLSSHSTSSLR